MTKARKAAWNRLLTRAASVLLLAQGIATPHVVNASGPFWVVPVFFDVPYDPQAYRAGQRFSPDGTSLAQVLTWLHMAESFGPAQQALFDTYLQQLNRNEPYVDGFNAWREALTALGRSAGYYSTAKWVSATTMRDGQRYTTESYVENCLQDAFVTATSTLQQRIARYGQDSPQLQRWLDAQVKVFSHCSGEAFAPPSEPDPAWEALERQDRAYQVAAAYFYDMQYAEAARRFAAIGNDAASPWAELARYLVGRSLVRQALVVQVDAQQNLADAKAVFDALGQDAAYVQRFPSVRGQQTFISIRQDTPGFVTRIASLLESDPARVSVDELADFLFLWNNRTQAVADDGSMLHWLRLANDPSNEATRAIVAAWQTYRTRPWLYLALSRNHGSTAPAAIDELAQQSVELDADTPANAALLVETAWMLQRTGRIERSAVLVQRVLGDPQSVLTLPQRNRLAYVLAQSSTQWRDFAVRAQLDVTALTMDSNQYLAMTPEGLAAETHDSPLFPPDAAGLINAYYTPAMLLDLIRDGQLSGYLVGRVAIAAWVKALMLDDSVSAQALARILADYYPERRDALERYLQGPDADFEAAALLFDLPGYSPFLNARTGRKSMGSQDGFVPDHVADGLKEQNWWCTMVYDYQDADAQEAYRGQWSQQAAEELKQPMFSTFSDAEKTDLAAMQPRLQLNVVAAFGPAVLEYARAHGDDPRVPRLLHRVVFASRYACNSGPGNVSRAAFELLHANYPDSEWAEKTPYWFE